MSAKRKTYKFKTTVPQKCFIALLVKHLCMEASFHRFITVPKISLPLQFDHPKFHNHTAVYHLNYEWSHTLLCFMWRMRCPILWSLSNKMCISFPTNTAHILLSFNEVFCGSTLNYICCNQKGLMLTGALSCLNHHSYFEPSFHAG